MEGNLEFGPERRRCLRQKVHAPAFASFDGVTGGMILDLSEEGLAMQMGGPFDVWGLDRGRRVRVELDLAGLHVSGRDLLEADFAEPDLAKPAARLTASKLETTGYIAWADALGRAGVRFSDLPEDARRRLNEWLAVNAGAPSRTAPKVALGWPRAAGAAARFDEGRGRVVGDHVAGDHVSISLEAETGAAENGSAENGDERPAWATVQYEFSSLGTDLTAALRVIGERARALTRGTSAAIGLAHKGGVMCRASVGKSAPALGARLDVNCGLSGECFREGKTLRCDDAENDPRVDLESCRRLGVRSIVAAPVRYERDTVGLLMVFAEQPFSFDEGDVAVVESLAHTVVRSMRQADAS
jgi:hypothetical protein